MPHWSLPAATARPRAAPSSASTFSTARPLHCLAGFYGGEADARAVVRQLERDHGLLPSQWLLLGPDDADRRRFDALARRWAPKSAAGTQARRAQGLPLAALAALLVGLALLAWLAVGRGADMPLVQYSLLAAGLLGVLVTLALLWRALPLSGPSSRFDQSIRHELSAGCWAVVVRGMTRSNQGSVLRLLRRRSLRWCAAPAPGERPRGGAQGSEPESRFRSTNWH